MKAKERRFFGAKLRLARTFHGLTQVELARRISCTHSWIGHAEADHKQPSKAMLDAICDGLGFRDQFFYEPLIDEFRDDECNFRSRKTLTAAARACVLSHGTLFAQLVRYLDACLSLPEDNIPEIRAESNDAIERLAEQCRMHWGLGLDRPIASMCRLLESSGAVATRIETGDVAVDAFSRAGRRHVVVLTSDKGRPSRARFDAAHELGHLVMHRGMRTGLPEQETHADRFASAFLLPRAGFMREFPRSHRVDWDRVFSIKRHWGVSAAAIVRRAHDLCLIDGVQYQQAYKHMQWKRWPKIGEPDEPEMEHPETVRLACETMRSEFGETAADLEGKLGWRSGILQKVVCFELAEDEPEPSKGVLVFLDAVREAPTEANCANDATAETSE
jgi:Zn-dependent peptidase ImmA (M78 family)/transcriptional regulator with XRE-family HTH domain